ncbi:MAG: hypothetical protein P8X90_21230 [Desulfobacterales bacterium]
MSNPFGETIFDDVLTFSKGGVLQAEAQQNAATLSDWSENSWSGYGFKLPGDSNLPAGTYTFTATASDGSRITETLEYPGKQELPVPSTEQFSYQWLADGGLKMMWQTPTGDYDNLGIWADDQDGNGLFSVWTRSKDVNSVIIAKSTIDEISGLNANPPQVAKVNLQTRKYSAAGIEIARGISDTLDLVWLSSQDRLTVESDYLQYRTFGDDISDEYRGWIGLTKGNQPIEAADIAEIKLLKSDGSVVEGFTTTFLTDEYSNAAYNSETGGFDFLGSSAYAGYSLRFPADMQLPAGNYVFEITSSQNEVLTRALSFPEEPDLPFDDSTGMTYRWSAGALTLNWTKPSGTFDEFRVIVDNNDGTDILYVKAPPDVQSVTIPKEQIDSLKTVVPIANWYWRIQTCAYSDAGMNYARGFSRGCKIYPEGEDASIYASWRSFQYRTFSDPAANRYTAMLQLNNIDGSLIDQADITEVKLNNPSGESIFDGTAWFIKGGQLKADVFDNSGDLYNWRLEQWSIFGFSIADGTVFPAGTYTWEATAADGSLIASSFEYPGQVQLPVPDITKLSYEWLADGSLKLNFEMPAGAYDQFRILAGDENGKDLLTITVKAENINTVTIPKAAIDEITDFNEDPPFTANVALQTRSFGDDGAEIARGISDVVEIPWQPTENTLRIVDASLQYRTFANSFDTYRLWVELLKGHDPVAESDITDIQLSDSNGTAVETMIDGYFAGQYYAANYNAASADLDFSGPVFFSGYMVKKSTGLDAGDYLIEVTSSGGDILTRTVTFPGEVELPVVDSTSMTHSWSSGALTLSWSAPAGIFDKFKVSIFDDNDDTDILLIDVPPDVQTVTIPSDWVDTLKAVKPIENWHWQIQTRLYSAEGMNYSRSYSRVCKIQPEGAQASVYPTWRTFQYRTFSDPAANRYQGMLMLNHIDGTLIDQADITNIKMLNPSGEPIYDGPGMFFESGALNGDVFENSGPLYDWDWEQYSLFLFKISDGTVFPAGTYTWQATAANGSLITSSLEFPGQVELPVPDISKLSYEWLADGSLKLNFEMPAGDYDQFRIIASDQDGIDLFNIRIKSSGVNTVTLTDWWLEDIYWLNDARPTTMTVSLQTRSYGADGAEIARGISDGVDIPWQWVP